MGRSGEPDPEIQRLEGLLGKFRYDSPPLVFPEIIPNRRWKFFPWRIRLFPALTTAGVAVAAIVAVTFLVYRTKPTPSTLPGWDVSSVEGTPRIGEETISTKEGTSRLGIGQMLETDRQVTGQPSGRRYRQDRRGPEHTPTLAEHGLGAEADCSGSGNDSYLYLGTGRSIRGRHALGGHGGSGLCLHFAGRRFGRGDGAHIPRVGRIQAEWPRVLHTGGCSLRDPAEDRPRHAVLRGCIGGIPTALTRFDFEDSTPQQRAHDVAIVLGAARNRDALTLWHLLARVDDEQRVLVYNRLSLFVPPPATVTKEGILRLDQPMLDLLVERTWI